MAYRDPEQGRARDRERSRRRTAERRAQGPCSRYGDSHRTEWHRIVTFRPGLVDMLVKNARKGRLVYVAGKLQTRRWRKDGEDSDCFSSGRCTRCHSAKRSAAVRI